MKFIEIEAEKAFDMAVEARDENEKLIVCGSSECIEYLQESMEFNEIDDESTRKSAATISVNEWFSEKESQVKSEYEEDGWNFSDVIGTWPDTSSEKQDFMLNKDILSGELLKKVYGARVNASNSSEVMLSFKYGGWNDCPSTEEHMAIWKYWEEKYGAKIVGVGNDVIEAYVERPPQTKEEAMQLAFEQYYYCSDIVDQGCESISNLAAALQKSSVWYFWWD